MTNIVLDKIQRILRQLEGNPESVKNFIDPLRDLTSGIDIQNSLEQEPIRTMHHLSCTGGTLFSKCIASMPNVLVLNEINPFSKMNIPEGKADFTPTDLISLVRQGDTNFASEALIKDLFWSNLEVLRKKCWLSGRYLVLRDHSHSQFLFGDFNPGEPTLRDIIAERFPVESLVTTRNPKNAFSSMERYGWNKHFESGTYEEYEDRCRLFEQAFKGVEKISYEAFVKNPKKMMKQICNTLKLPYFDDFEDVFSAFKFSGDSGRSGDRIVRY